MKKKSVLLALVLTLALCFGSVQSVFANTFEGYTLENKAESTVYTFYNDVVKGKYKLVDTETLSTWLDKGDKVVIVDTMPDWSFDAAIGGGRANGHVPTAVNAEVGHGTGGAAYEWTEGQQEAFMKAINESIVDKGMGKYKWTKVSKKTYDKLDEDMRKISKNKYYKKGYSYNKKKVKVVVYCGFVGCARSHAGAAYLVKKGFKNVYRYGGGILAWKDAGKQAEGLAK